MDFSENYYKRNEKMRSLEVPAMCEVKQQLGDPLADVFFNTCPESLAGEMALSPLEGPGPDLWISPSDILMDKVVLKPPLTLKYLRALTHQSLLEIGRQIEEKYFRVLEEQKQRELAELEELLLFIAEKEKNLAVKLALEREHELFKQKLQQLNEEFEELMRQALANLEAQLKEMYEKLFEERMRNVLEEQEAVIRARIAEAVSEAVEILTKKFLESLEEQEKFLTDLFELKLLGQREKYKKLLKNEQEVFQTLLRQLKHNLQCNNIANLMYVLCVERRNCLHDKQEIIDEFQGKIAVLQQSLEEKEAEIKELTKERDEKSQQCDVRERCLYGVICQFQKFINFALKASPTQAEFLLSVKRMMTFELTQAIVQTSPKKHLFKELMPWKKDKQESEASFDMFLRDHHDCLNERPPPPVPVKEGASDDSLKAFNFNSKLYVREDFRNMITQGFYVKPSSTIWNKDVENLVNILKSSLEKESITVEESLQNQRSHNSSVHFGSVNADAVSASLERQDSQKVGLLGTADSVVLQKSHLSLENDEARCSYATRCDILAAKDSLTITNISPKSELLGEEDDAVFRKFSTETLKLPTPVKRTMQEDVGYRKVSSANINLKGKKQDEDVYKYAAEAPQEKHTHKLEKRTLSLSIHRNSLEVIRERLYKKRAGISKLLKVSYLEMKHPKYFAIDVPVDGKKLDVKFKHVAELYANLSQVDEPWVKRPDEAEAEYLPQPPQHLPRDDFLHKKNVGKVMGHIGTEHAESTKDFTVHRVHSIMDVLKKDSSLIRIFTNCAQ